MAAKSKLRFEVGDCLWTVSKSFRPDNKYKRPNSLILNIVVTRKAGGGPDYNATELGTNGETNLHCYDEELFVHRTDAAEAAMRHHADILKKLQRELNKYKRLMDKFAERERI